MQANALDHLVVIPGAEHLNGIDRHSQIPLQRPPVNDAQVCRLSLVYQNGLAE